MNQRDVDIERRRALIAMVRASIVELRYLERRHDLRPARFDGRYEMNPVVETVGADDRECRVVVKLEA